MTTREYKYDRALLVFGSEVDMMSVNEGVRTVIGRNTSGFDKSLMDGT